MIKDYDFMWMLQGIVNRLNELKEDKDYEGSILQADYEVIDNHKLIFNIVEHDSEYGFTDNKFVVEFKHVFKGDKDYDKIESWE